MDIPALDDLEVQLSAAMEDVSDKALADIFSNYQYYADAARAVAGNNLEILAARSGSKRLHDDLLRAALPADHPDYLDLRLAIYRDAKNRFPLPQSPWPNAVDERDAVSAVLFGILYGKTNAELLEYAPEYESDFYTSLQIIDVLKELRLAIERRYPELVGFKDYVSPTAPKRKASSPVFTTFGSINVATAPPMEQVRFNNAVADLALADFTAALAHRAKVVQKLAALVEGLTRVRRCGQIGTRPAPVTDNSGAD